MNLFSSIAIHSFNRYLLNTYYMPGTILGTGDATVKIFVSLMSLSVILSSRKQMVNVKHRATSDYSKCHERQSLAWSGWVFWNGQLENNPSEQMMTFGLCLSSESRTTSSISTVGMMPIAGSFLRAHESSSDLEKCYWH